MKKLQGEKKVNELYVYVKDVCPVRDKVKKKRESGVIINVRLVSEMCDG